MLTSDNRSSGLRCCIVTPIGPGHQQRYLECKASVQTAFRTDPGPFVELSFAAMDDPEGLQGRSLRRNDGIRLAVEQGADWIFFLDADDIMTPTAFARFKDFHQHYDAIWGGILEVLPGSQQPQLRSQQVAPITSLIGILDNDPTLTLQMGHFIRTKAARNILFDTDMDAGEDFKFYLQAWRDYRCIKQQAPFFINRRGIHSTGPRAADGLAWTEAVAAELVDFRIQNAERIERLYRQAGKHTRGRHIVVTGFSRSGTTMFYNMLRSSVRNFDFLDREYPAARIIGTHPRDLVSKRPLDIFDIPNILAANRRKKDIDFILVLRDIRSILTSRHQKVPDDYFIGYDYQYFIPPQGEPTRTIPGVLPTYQAIVRLLQGDSPGQKIIVRYEDLVQSTTRIQSYLAHCLAFSYREHFRNFHKAEIPTALQAPLNTIDAPDAARVSKWQLPEHRARIRSQFTQCPALFDILIQTGYEKDRRWFEAFR